MSVTPKAVPASQRPDITEAFSEFDLVSNNSGAIGLRVLPAINVGTQAGSYGRIPAEEMLHEASIDRTSSGAYPRSDFQFTDEVYKTKEEGHEGRLDERNDAIYSNFADWEMVLGERIRGLLTVESEKRYAAAVYNETTFAGKITTPTVPWSTHATADPAKDVGDAKLSVWNQCGRWPNALVINEHQRHHAVRCATIIEKIKYSGIDDPKPGNISLSALAAALDIGEIIVAGNAQNTANREKNAVYANVWSNTYAMVGIIARTNDFAEVCIGRTFHWTGDGSRLGGAFEQYTDPTVRGEILRVRQEVQRRIIYPEAGHLLKTVL